MKQLKEFLFCALFLTISLTASSGNLNFNDFFNSSLQKPDVEKLIKQRIDSGKGFGIVVGIIDPDGVSFYNYGCLGFDDPTPVNEETVFELGSLTKAFTASLLQDMHEKNELSLDDPVETFFPDIHIPNYQGQKILLKHLITHTGGLPYLPYNFQCQDISNPFANYNMQQVFDFLNSYELPRPPGEQYDYSNLSVGLVGYIISGGSAASYQQILQERICQPLGLKNTSLGPTPAMEQNLSKAHVGNQVVPFWEFPVLFGTGGIYSTVKDLACFLKTHMGLTNSVLTDTFQKTHKIYRSADEPNLSIASAWHVSECFPSKVIYLNGGTGGCRSYIGFCPDTQRGVVILSNSAVNINDLGFHLVDPRYSLKKEDRAIALDSFILDKYVGKYQHPSGLVFTISKKNQGLTVHLPGYPTAEIFPETTTRFFLKIITATVDFDFDDSNNVQGLYFSYSGSIHPASKIQ